MMKAFVPFTLKPEALNPEPSTISYITSIVSLKGATEGTLCPS